MDEQELKQVFGPEGYLNMRKRDVVVGIIMTLLCAGLTTSFYFSAKKDPRDRSSFRIFLLATGVGACGTCGSVRDIKRELQQRQR